MKLNPEDLVVSSFDTTAAADATSPVIARPTITTNDPTAQTWCFICPVETETCW
jgi:hypothetical protein